VKTKRLIIFGVLAVLVVAYIISVLSNFRHRAEREKTIGALQGLSHDRIEAAIRSLIRDGKASGTALPAAASLRELVSGGYLRAEDIRGLENRDATVSLSTDSAAPQTIWIRVHDTDGSDIVLMADGSVQELRSHQNTMRLKIELFTNWTQHQNQTSAATFYRQGSTSAFQVSWAEYRGKQPLRKISTDGLKQFAINFGQKNASGELIEASYGGCRFGNYGTAVFRSEKHPRIQIWIVTDGRDYILATHVCDRYPEPSEVAEVQQIARSLALGPEQPQKPKWKFW